MTADPTNDPDGARRLLLVLATVDGGCHSCVEELCRELVRAFPGDWASVVPDGDEDGYWDSFSVEDWRRWLGAPTAPPVGD